MARSKFKHYFIYFTGLFIFLGIASQLLPIRQQPIKPAILAINKIPPSDRRILDNFFCYLIRHHVFGYTLIGEKPISEEVFIEEIDPNLIESGMIGSPAVPLFLGWHTWIKYQHQFPIKKDFLFRSKVIQNQGESPYRYLILIHKKKALEEIQKNLDLFQKVSGQSLTAQQFFELLEIDDPLFNSWVNNHQGLRGILFGYGRINSVLFDRSVALVDYFKQLIKSTLQPAFQSPHSLAKITPLTRKLILLFGNNSNQSALSKIESSEPLTFLGFKSLEAEVEFLINNRRRFSISLDEKDKHNSDIDYIYEPGFVIWNVPDSAAENRELVERYKRAHKILTEKFRDGGFLHKTLEILTNEPS
jgi:hypothetical protein